MEGRVWGFCAEPSRLLLSLVQVFAEGMSSPALWPVLPGRPSWDTEALPAPRGWGQAVSEGDGKAVRGSVNPEWGGCWGPQVVIPHADSHR